jgi:hypothetical protein
MLPTKRTTRGPLLSDTATSVSLDDHNDEQHSPRGADVALPGKDVSYLCAVGKDSFIKQAVST